MSKKIKISISGMHCAACAGNVERSIKKLKDIENVSVSIMTNKAIINAKDTVKTEDIKKAVEQVGYQVTKVE